MVKLTCLVRRKEGMSPEEFHAYWRDRHGPLVASTRSGSHVLRYEQHHRPLAEYGAEDDGGYDGVTVQWFDSMDEYRAHIAEKDFADVWADLPEFLDVDRLAFVLTEEPVVVMAGSGPISG
ncbi:MAG TPA: EthD domain-containing protein [Acidimicrobiales bacterium]|nr:EthD domain-containing protein [Acidimicrobiales bacterium]